MKDRVYREDEAIGLYWALRGRRAGTNAHMRVKITDKYAGRGLSECFIPTEIDPEAFVAMQMG